MNVIRFDLSLDLVPFAVNHLADDCPVLPKIENLLCKLRYVLSLAQVRVFPFPKKRLLFPAWTPTTNVQGKQAASENAHHQVSGFHRFFQSLCKQA